MSTRSSDRLPYVGWKMRERRLQGWPEVIYEDGFFDSVYELMYSAESAYEYVELIDRLLDECERVGSDPSGVRQDRRAFERASIKLLVAMRNEAVKVSELLPAFVRACVLDRGAGAHRVHKLLDARANQLDKLWERLAKAANPVGRRAAGDAVYCLAIAAHAKQTKVRSKAPLSKRDAQHLLNAATDVMGAHRSAIRTSEELEVRSGRTLLDALAGVIVHMQMHTAASLTLTAESRPDLEITVSFRPSEPTRVEVIGTPVAIEGGASVAQQRRSLRALGFEAPTRRADERAWHCSFAKLSPVEIPLLIANVLEQVIGVSLGETLQLETTNRLSRRR